LPGTPWGSSCPTPACCGLPHRPRLRPRVGAHLTAAVRRPSTDRTGLAHYGLLADPLDVLDEAGGDAAEVGRRRRDGLPQGDDIAAALATEFESDLDGVPEEHLEKLEVMNGVHSNAAGLHRC